MDTPVASRYFPDRVWQRRTPAESGIDPKRLQAAIDHAVRSEVGNPRDLAMNHYQTFGREPFGYAIGPIKERADQTGLVVHKGHIVAEWGNPERVDMTHSITKSMITMVVGLACDRGLIGSVDDTVREYVAPILPYSPSPAVNKSDRMGGSDFLYPFETPHNRTITWNHMLRQVSDWEGTLWGKPDWADRPSEKASEWGTRPRHKPGTVYQYNDVRTNALALAALNVWRRPLPQVLRDNVLEPIAASATWRWFGYENSWIVLDGQPVQSVTGGGHWGGGLFVNAYDLARFGLLTMNRGRWKERQIVSEKWIDMALTPTPVEPSYGFMNFYNNKDRVFLPSAPASAFAHQGNGTNLVYVDPENDLVAVLRWIDKPKIDGFVKLLLEAVG